MKARGKVTGGLETALWQEGRKNHCLYLCYYMRIFHLIITLITKRSSEEYCKSKFAYIVHRFSFTRLHMSLMFWQIIINGAKSTTTLGSIQAHMPPKVQRRLVILQFVLLLFQFKQLRFSCSLQSYFPSENLSQCLSPGAFLPDIWHYLPRDTADHLARRAVLPTLSSPDILERKFS